MTDTDTAAIPTWHHPHFIAAQQHGSGIRWQFRPFVGDEPEPKIPADVEAAFNTARNVHLRDSDAGRAVSAAWRAADVECRAANTLWRVARHNRHVTDLLKQIAPLVAAFQQAKQRAVDAYKELHGTPDGFWQAKLLTLTELRQVALDAARQLDRVSGDLAGATDGLPERVLEEIPLLSELEKLAGVDLGGWCPEESFGYGDGPDAQQLNELFDGQDERITRVARLFAGDDR